MDRDLQSVAKQQISLNLAAEELKQPLYVKVRQILRGQIATSFQHDQRFYSERELIKKLRVSQPTIRRALRDLVSEGYLRPAQRRGFFVQKIFPARHVGLICPGLSESLGRTSEEAISLACRTENYMLDVYYAHKGESVDLLFQSIRHRASEERIILTGMTTEFTVEMGAKLQNSGFKHLVIGPHFTGFTGSSLAFDHDAEINQVFDHLIGLGHERVVYMVNEPRSLFITSQRAEALRRKLDERNLKNSSLIYCDTKSWENSFEAAYRKMDEIWQMNPKPTAVVPLSGVGAWAVLRYAFRHGIRVPDDLSIVSFDPMNNSQLLPCSLTELSFSHADRAKQALRMLWAESLMPLHEQFQTQLVPRESTGPAPHI